MKTMLITMDRESIKQCIGEISREMRRKKITLRSISEKTGIPRGTLTNYLEMRTSMPLEVFVKCWECFGYSLAITTIDNELITSTYKGKD